MKRLSLVSASLTKRSIAYFIDMMLIVIPLVVAIAWTVRHLFAPLPMLGWGVIVFLGMIAFAYTLILAAQNASTGSTVGKRLMGIRTLRAESLKTGDFGDAYARGFSYFLGMLGLGVAPIIMATRMAKGAENEFWPHKAGNTLVLDVRQGKDPLKQETQFFPLYPEEWGGDTRHSAIRGIYPPVAPRWSPAFVLPEETPQLLAPRVTATDFFDIQQKNKKKELWRATGQGVFTLLATFGSITAVAVAATALNPEMPKPRDEHEVLASSLSEKLPIAGYGGQGFPGYKNTPDWTKEVAAESKVFATIDQVFTLNNRELQVLSAADGKLIKSISINSSVEVSAQTYFSGEPGIYWSSGDTAYGWNESLGQKDPFSAKIPAGAEPYAAGNELLFAGKSDVPDQYKAWRFTEKGFTEMPVPSGYIPAAFNGENLVSYNHAGEVKITSNESDISAYPLQSPKDSLPFAGIVSAGNDRVVALWSPYPDSTAGNTPVTVAFYNSDDGDLLSYIETTRERVNAYSNLSWGPDGSTAMYAGYLFDVRSGRATTDLLAQQVEPISVIGEGALGENSLGSVYVTPSEVLSISGTTPLLANSDLAVAKTRTNIIEKYSK
ncbi:RDD family protein [Rothia nasimurium]|uniref:RDD family protein n=1 Tax=Rothia nasimurium TaxID=85336 RepID=UPI001F2A585A|nr:RDD family protein [Rothia nasimurium]